MNQQQQSIVCQMHQQECIVIDISTQCDPTQRYKCPKCLISKKRLCHQLMLSEANVYYSQQKNDYKDKVMSKNQKNLEILKDVISNISSLKQIYNQCFDKINQNLEQQIVSLQQKQERLADQLQQITIDEYLKINKNTSFLESNQKEAINIIQTQLEMIQNIDILHQCIRLIKSLDNNDILFVPEQEFEEEKVLSKMRIPYLPISCETHGKEIIYLDLNDQRAREHKMACLFCVSNKVGPFTDLVTAERLWETYQKQKSFKFSLVDKYQMKIEQDYQSLNSLLIKVESKINETNSNLAKKQLEIQNFVEQEIQTTKTNFLTLSKEEMINIAEILSKKQNNDEFQLQEEYFQSIEIDQNYIIYEAKKYLNDVLNDMILATSIKEQQFIKRNQECQTSKIKKNNLYIQQNVFTVFLENKQIPFSKNQQETKMKLNLYLINQNYGGIKKNTLGTQEIQLKQEDFISLNQRPYQVVFAKKQQDECNAIAFNKQQTILVAGCGPNKIVVYEFKFDQMQQKQILCNHTCNYNITSLCFMQNENKFISGSLKEIAIWEYNNSTQQWFCQQMMKDAHSSHVSRVIINDKDDLIVSCSEDKKIKFWVKQQEWAHFQTIESHTGNVCTICFNEQCIQLASSCSDNKILISQKGNDHYWSVIQTIQVKLYGSRIAFIDNNILTFQPFNGSNMEIYQLDQQNKKFIKFKEVPVQQIGSCRWWFQQTFSKRKQILVNKNGYIVNLMRKKDCDFVVEQFIKFEGEVHGVMSDDGEFLVTWDQASREFQVRKQK